MFLDETVDPGIGFDSLRLWKVFQRESRVHFKAERFSFAVVFVEERLDRIFIADFDVVEEDLYSEMVEKLKFPIEVTHVRVLLLALPTVDDVVFLEFEPEIGIKYFIFHDQGRLQLKKGIR